MVAIVAGNGLGLFNASLNTLGGSGVGGQGGGLGQAGGQSYVNASNGNLILRFNDEQLSGLSQGLNQLRTYNSQGSGLDLSGSPVASVWLYNTSSNYVGQAAIARHTLIESGSRNIVIDNMASWLNENIDTFEFTAPLGSVDVTGGSYGIDIFDGRWFWKLLDFY